MRNYRLVVDNAELIKSCDVAPIKNIIRYILGMKEDKYRLDKVVDEDEETTYYFISD